MKVRSLNMLKILFSLSVIGFFGESAFALNLNTTRANIKKNRFI